MIEKRPSTANEAERALRAYRESLTPEERATHEEYAGKVLAAFSPRGRRRIALVIDRIPWEKLSPEHRARVCFLLRAELLAKGDP